MEYIIKVMKCVATKYEEKTILTIDFESEIVDLFATKGCDSTAADFEKHLKIR